jgi:hypothetical protein
VTPVYWADSGEFSGSTTDRTSRPGYLAAPFLRR